MTVAAIPVAADSTSTIANNVIQQHGIFHFEHFPGAFVEGFFKSFQHHILIAAIFFLCRRKRETGKFSAFIKRLLNLLNRFNPDPFTGLELKRWRGGTRPEFLGDRRSFSARPSESISQADISFAQKTHLRQRPPNPLKPSENRVDRQPRRPLPETHFFSVLQRFQLAMIHQQLSLCVRHDCEPVTIQDRLRIHPTVAVMPGTRFARSLIEFKVWAVWPKKVLL